MELFYLSEEEVAFFRSHADHMPISETKVKQMFPDEERLNYLISLGYIKRLNRTIRDVPLYAVIKQPMSPAQPIFF